MTIYFILMLIVTLVAYYIFVVPKSKKLKRNAQLIDTYTFPESIKDKLKSKHPHLSDGELNDVVKGLREYFHICNVAGTRLVSMPSQVVDDAWHEFILFTKEYEYFCRRALGRFLHHTPAEAMSSPTKAQAGIKVAWRIACRREKINPASPHRLPFLFALDKRLSISNGFYYSLDCTRGKSSDHCASHIGCGGSGCAGGGSGDSASCGGGGCGGS